MRSDRTGSRQLMKMEQDLSPRDREIVRMVADLRLMSGHQIAEVHFSAAVESSSETAERVARRVLQKMTERRLLLRLEREVGGLRGGSGSFIYALGPVGQRVLALDGPRRRFREPSTTFAEHTLAVADLVVSLKLSARSEAIELLSIEPEPTSWRQFQTAAGNGVLRPDLFVSLGVGAYEHRWFIEVDLGTEHFPALLRKCRVYQSYFQSGAEQSNHGVFPRVCWAMTDTRRAQRLEETIAKDRKLTSELFVCVDMDESVRTVSGSAS